MVNKKLSGPVVVFGEVLFDIFPDRRCLGGAPFNFAFHLNGFGIPIIFISRVGEDALGREILNFARSFDFPVDGIQSGADHSTGEVQVTLDSAGGPKFDIVSDKAYDYIDTSSFIESLNSDEVPLFYFGTLIQRNAVSSATLRDLLIKFELGSSLFCDLNLRAPFYDRKVVEETLGFADILKISSEELTEIGNLIQYRGQEKDLIFYLLENYKIGKICLTKGSEGSELYSSGSDDSFFCPVNPVENIVDTVGAGDAFSSMFAAGLLAGWPEQTILDKATEFASKICQIPGALPDNKDFYRSFEVV